MPRASKPKADRKPAKPKKARPAYLTPLEAARIAERYRGNGEVALWLKSVPIRRDPA